MGLADKLVFNAKHFPFLRLHQCMDLVYARHKGALHSVRRLLLLICAIAMYKMCWSELGITVRQKGYASANRVLTGNPFLPATRVYHPPCCPYETAATLVLS
jgi:hypothetical protein